jgi:hypothetical protein
MSTVITRDQLSVWLAGVHADPELSDHAFKVAFTLSQAADASGFVRSSALAKISNDREPIADVLGRLAARGHLEARGNQRKIEGFQIIVPVARASVPRRSKTASIVPFPVAERGAFIHKQAARIATLSQAQGDAHLRQQLRIQADAMRRKGVTEEIITREIRSAESAIKAELWRCILTPEKPA